ncbi:MAG: hypothetical protein JSR19_02985 [Proteobacteria bacterium]|nr:hypothetical protein [Pseudomonadota bacterium]HQR03834.1 hypothetical protein [Rhodocyclaceae bacterium]
MPAPRIFYLLCVTATLTACASGPAVVGSTGTDGKPATESTNTLQVSDIPIPAGAKLDPDKTLIMGANDRWLGRIVLRTDLPPVQVFNHFYNGMANFGWTLLTAVQGTPSLQTWQRGERVALIQTETASLGGTAATITVSSRQTTAPEASRPSGR